MDALISPHSLYSAQPFLGCVVDAANASRVPKSDEIKDAKYEQAARQEIADLPPGTAFEVTEAIEIQQKKLWHGLCYYYRKCNRGEIQMIGSSLDAALGIHDNALKLREQRASLLAANIANAETPNYKAKDLDFKNVLSRMAHQSGTLAPVATSDQHLQANPDQLYQGEVQFRRALNPSLDGNTVDTQMEYLEFARNTAEYQASLKLLGDKFKGLRVAITGGQ